MLQNNTTELELIKNSDITLMELKEVDERYMFLRNLLDSITAEKEKVTKPLNEALKAERARFKPAEEQVTELISTYKGRLIELLAIEKAKTSEERAEAEKPTVKSVELTRLNITDVSLIPRELMVPDEKRILEILKQGHQVPGAEIIKEMTIRK